MSSRLWQFLLDRATEAREGQYFRDLGLSDLVLATLAVHNEHDANDTSCAGCGLTSEGEPVAAHLDQCSTLRALAWKWNNHPMWRPHWELEPQPYLATWPAGQNCFCGRRTGGTPHRRGTGPRCRPGHFHGGPFVTTGTPAGGPKRGVA